MTKESKIELQRNAMNQNKDKNISLNNLFWIIGNQMTTKDIQVHRMWLVDGRDLYDILEPDCSECHLPCLCCNSKQLYFPELSMNLLDS